VVALGLAGEPALRLASGPASRAVASRGLPPLEQRSTVHAADGTGLAILHDGINRRVVPLDRIPEVVQRAIVAAEDQRFWRHSGYDTNAVARAALANLQAREVTQGASTVSQQLAKANFTGDEPTVARKAKELVYAVALEGRYSKAELLERYLNQVYFGSGAYGVEAAAEEFFGVRAQDLTLTQAALLAGLIRAPVATDPRDNPEAARLRRNQVLAAMGAPKEAFEAPLGVVPHREFRVSEPFTVEAAKREFLANPAFGATEEERKRLLLTGGVEIHTTLDLDVQAAARTAADTATNAVSSRLGSAVVAVDPRTGAVRALHDGGLAAQGDFDVATQGRREPGSTFKPLAAVAALEDGMPPWQILVGDGPVEIDYGAGRAPWRVRNFKDADYGFVDLREAVVNSVNTAFAQLGVALGPDRIAGVAQRLGIDVDGALGSPAERGPSIALGGLAYGVSPLELASAYGTFAAGGTHVTPHLIDRVVGADGREMYRAAPEPAKVVEPAVNAEIVDMLQEAVAEGTGAAATLPGWKPLGKTGTSEGSADAWFVGAVPTLAAAVWVGDPASARAVPGLTGGVHAAPIWRKFMATALDGAKVVDFPDADAARTGVKPITLPVARPCGAPCATATEA
ncbi:MAG: transglycosylase domain-containing protein, partial [Acidimicrobiales bacterium]